jgi:hypothetical protein
MTSFNNLCHDISNGHINIKEELWFGNVTPIHCNPFKKVANEQVRYLDLHQFAFPNLAPSNFNQCWLVIIIMI